jgi:undecaprenyl-diphosphatase
MAQIDMLIAIILGIFQGITEWMPISSSGQTILAMVDVLKIDSESALSFAYYLHFGTLLAVLLKMRRDVKHIITRLPKVKEDKLVQFIVISTIATTAVGIPVYIFLRNVFSGGIGGEIITALIGIFLLETGVILHYTKKWRSSRVLSESNAKDSIVAGVGQGFSVIPGLSRSGITIAALVARNIKQEEALRLSFLMSIPAISGIIILEGLRGIPESLSIEIIVAGVAAAFIVGYFVIDILLRYAKRVKFDLFCVTFGMIAIFVASLVLI